MYNNNNNPINIIGHVTPAVLDFLIVSKTIFNVVPLSNAIWLAFCIVGPSAIGSEKGTPSSIISAPPASNAFKYSHVSLILG